MKQYWFIIVMGYNRTYSQWQSSHLNMFQIQKKSEDQKKIRNMFKIQNFSLFFRRSGHPDKDDDCNAVSSVMIASFYVTEKHLFWFLYIWRKHQQSWDSEIFPLLFHLLSLEMGSLLNNLNLCRSLLGLQHHLRSSQIRFKNF